MYNQLLNGSDGLRISLTLKNMRVTSTVHFKKDGELMCILLDLVEVAESHSSVNLAMTFSKVLDDFGISEKVSNLHTLIIGIQN